MIAFLPGPEPAQRTDELVRREELQALAEFLFANRQYFLTAAEVIATVTNQRDFGFWQMSFLRKAATRKSIKKEGRRAGGGADNQFVNLLRSVYDLAYCLPGKETENLARLRGAVLEALVARILRSRYDEVATNCCVEVNGAVVKLPEEAYPRSVDVAGVKRSGEELRGEIYECKAGSAYVEKRDLKFLAELRRRLHEAGLRGVLVALVSFEGRAALEGALRRLRVKWRGVLAREDLGALYDYQSVNNILGS